MKKITAVLAAVLTSVMLVGCGSSGHKEEAYIRDNGGAYTSSKDANFAYNEGMMFESPSNASYSDSYEGKTAYSREASTGTSSDVTDTTVISESETGTTRKVIKTANLKVETLEFDNFINGLKADIDVYGGYIERSNVSGNNIYSTTTRSAQFTIRIPQDKIDGFLGCIGNYGTVTSTNYNEDDVTLQYVDVESRIRTLQTEQKTLLGLLEKAEYINDVIELEARLSQVNYDIESYTSRLRTYDNQITYSSVTVNVVEVTRITPTVKEPVKEQTLGERIAVEFKEYMNDLWEGIQDFIVWIITHIVGLIIWAVIIIVAIILIRRSLKKKKAEKAAAAAEAAVKQAAYAEHLAKINNTNETDMGNKE